jgi:hypothetical protein
VNTALRKFLNNPWEFSVMVFKNRT